MLNARFSLSLYCSRHLYSVTSRRWTNDHWLSQSTEWAGQRSSCPPLISLSTQYEQEQLYFCISNVSHRRGLITMHCTDTVPPIDYTSLHDHLLMLHVQVTPFTQHRFNTEQSVHDLGHFQQFRRCLIEPAAIHTQQHSQNPSVDDKHLL